MGAGMAAKVPRWKGLEQVIFHRVYPRVFHRVGVCCPCFRLGAGAGGEAV